MDLLQSKAISIKKLYHNEEWHIGLYFDYDKVLIDRIKNLPNRKYSRSNKCWYIPYTKDDYNHLKLSGLSFTIDTSLDTRQAALQSDIIDIDPISGSSSHSAEEKDSGNLAADINTSSTTTDVLQNIVFNSGSFYITINYVMDEVDFLKSLKKCYWNKKEKSWICQGNLNNLDALQSRYNYWNDGQYQLIRDQIINIKSPPRAILQMTDDGEQYYTLHIKGTNSSPEWIKKETNRKFDSIKRRWILPNDEPAKKRLIDRLSYEGYSISDHTSYGYRDVNYSRDWGKRKKYLLSKCPDKHKSHLDKYISMLMMQRYSWNTVKQYSSSLLRYLIYTDQQDINPHEDTSVIQYLSSISERKVSYQEINRHQSALRAYFAKVVTDVSIDFDRIQRPRRPNTLPKVMSKGQVINLLSQVQNKKHLSMLYLAYGSGLRSGEIINLKCHDLDFENERIWIRSSKGNKDRIVPMAKSIMAILRTYILEYKPGFWVFEGGKPNTPYSSSSLGLIFRRARQGAGLPKHFTLHSLRHSYATHLMDSGTDLRLIKDLLGHKDIKTTLIYTHVTDQSLRRVLSPLDELLRKSDQNDGF